MHCRSRQVKHRKHPTLRFSLDKIVNKNDHVRFRFLSNAVTCMRFVFLSEEVDAHPCLYDGIIKKERDYVELLHFLSYG